ncbi:coagulation factor XIII A chain [Megalops cyprinoides]|uniref:coagulation factor XIII A chain n=1 Tax=Megalops cyprinoides TaxID=118141 RepID=UPI001863DA0E|nr:coagulation factor XIII A chain [Megalops cyprinoides]
MSQPEPRPAQPQVSHRGRSNAPVATSNAEGEDSPEFEPFNALSPRGFPPLTEYLDIWDVNMLSRPDEMNKQEHHTDLFSSSLLIVRRGQEFQIRITFDRAYNPSKDQFLVEFVIGTSPQVSKGTYMPVFPDPDRQGQWRGRVVDSIDNIVTVGITPAPDCIVGKFRMYVAVLTPYGIRRTRRDPKKDLYILFNPWVSDDTVFLDNEEERGEYILNESGIVYHGEANDISARPWNFGQFEYGILDACLYVMDKAVMPITNRGDPIKVARKASAALNSRDDEGVLVGNWSGDYTYGVAPTSWTGSVEILLTYASSQQPVCYAQCWVYAAVFNTFLRCLGIPARVVTNFYSAHDNDGNLKTDIILNDEGKVDRARTKDSIWNYHCWNECYMSRPDLPTGFGGWQAVDATPQETSDGLYRCGPASVHAIKHGEICYPFDAPFVFAEVNSDVVFYERNKNGSMQVVKVNRSHVGRKILTKAIGRDEPVEITSLYKFQEGTDEERTVTEKADGYGVTRQKDTSAQADVHLELLAQEVSVGDDFQLTLEFKNNSGNRHTVNAYVNGYVVYYTGVTSDEVKSKTLKVTVEPWQSQRVAVDVRSKDYLNKLVEQASLHFIVNGRVDDGSQIVSAMRVITLHAPKLTIKVTGVPRVSEEMFVTVEFTNPFQFNLDNVFLRVEGPGLMAPKSKHYSLISSKSPLTWTEAFTPRRPGRSKLMVTLDCAALRQVYGQVDVDIKP